MAREMDQHPDGFSYSFDQIGSAAAFVLERAVKAKVLAFYGPMGAGKTSLITAICKHMCCSGEVSSPTFSLVNEYSCGGETVYHFDFYRIRNVQEAFDLGYEEYFYSGSLCLIEWPEKVEELLPPGCMKLRIDIVDENKRCIFIL